MANDDQESRDGREGCEFCGNDPCTHSTEPCGPPEVVAAPAPTTRRYPVKVYFFAYVVDTGKGRRYGNQIIKSPNGLGTTPQLRKIEELISQALPATHGIVGNRGIVTITSVTDLGTMVVEETITDEGAAADPNAPLAADNADQPS